jgi:hypothetical protein
LAIDLKYGEKGKPLADSVLMIMLERKPKEKSISGRRAM